MSNCRALVTGCTGYVGTHLCNRLLENGWIVEGIVRTHGRPLSTDLSEMMSVHTYDGSIESLVKAVDKSQPDVVFHLASLVLAEHRTEQVTDIINSNVLFGVQLIEACAKSGIKNFVNTGTSWQHYRSNDYDPVCLYSATKQAFEDILDFYTDAFGVSVITLKLFDTYGPDDERPKLVNLLINAVITGTPIGLSPGYQKLDLCHIDDVTEAFKCCADILFDESNSRGHKKYVVSSGELISVRQLVDLLQEISGDCLDVTYGARSYREREVLLPWQNGDMLPNWNPTIELKSGLESLLTKAQTDK